MKNSRSSEEASEDDDEENEDLEGNNNHSPNSSEDEDSSAPSLSLGLSTLSSSPSSSSSSSSSESEDSSASTEKSSSSAKRKGRKNAWSYRKRRMSATGARPRGSAQQENMSRVYRDQKRLSSSTSSSSSSSSSSSTSSDRSSASDVSNYSSGDEGPSFGDDVNSNIGSAGNIPKVVVSKGKLRAVQKQSEPSPEFLGTRSWTRQAKINSTKFSRTNGNNNNIPNGKGSSTYSKCKRKIESTDDRKAILYGFYHNNPYPSKRDFAQLQKKTGMSPKSLLYWFSNRRRRDDIAVKRTPKGNIDRNDEDAKREQEVLDVKRRLAEIRAKKSAKRPQSSKRCAKLVENSADREPAKRGRPRISFPAKNPKKILLEFYQSNPNPSKSQLQDLEKVTGLPRKKIRDFISYRRRRDLKSHQSTNDVQDDQKEDHGIPEDRVSGVIGSVKDFSCLVCRTYRTDKRPNLLRHLRKVHSQKPKVCKRCLFVFDKAAYRSHPCFLRSIQKQAKPKEISAEQKHEQKRYRELLKNFAVEDSMPKSGKGFFERNGKLEVFMVNHSQYKAVQRFIWGDTSISVRVVEKEMRITVVILPMNE